MESMNKNSNSDLSQFAAGKELSWLNDYNNYVMARNEDVDNLMPRGFMPLKVLIQGAEISGGYFKVGNLVVVNFYLINAGEISDSLNSSALRTAIVSGLPSAAASSPLLNVSRVINGGKELRVGVASIIDKQMKIAIPGGTTGTTIYVHGTYLTNEKM